MAAADVRPGLGGRMLARSAWTWRARTVAGGYPHDDQFAVRFLFDLTFKPTGQRRTIVPLPGRGGWLTGRDRRCSVSPW